MARECNYCGFRDPMPFTCKFCGNAYCYSHRLPESHSCPGLADYNKKLRESGMIYKPEIVKRRRPNKLTDSLIRIFSTIKSNYSLTILLICGLSFVLQYIIPGYYSYFSLTPYYIFSRPWTLVTHIFLHSGPIHLFFNMLFLFFIGPELERRIGGKKFLVVFFLSGIIAAIGYSLWSVFILKQYSSAVGASGALFGIFACLAILAPDIVLYVYFVPMKITHALVFFALFDLLLISQSGDLVARSAHLSGVVAGLVIGRYIKKTGRYSRF